MKTKKIIVKKDKKPEYKGKLTGVDGKKNKKLIAMALRASK